MHCDDTHTHTHRLQMCVLVSLLPPVNTSQNLAAVNQQLRSASWFDHLWAILLDQFEKQNVLLWSDRRALIS